MKNLAAARLLIALGALAASGWASGQTTIAGTLECAGPSFQGTIEAGDRAGHAMALSQRPCAWSRPLRLEGLSSADATVALFTDARDDRVRDNGYIAITMSNGDRVFLHCVRTGSPGGARSSGAFAFSGGTGKFRGLYGSGTLESRSHASGEMTLVLEGEYTLPRLQ